MINENSYKELMKELNFCIRHVAFIENQEKIINLLNENVDTGKFVNLMALNVPLEMFEKREVYFLIKAFRELVINEKFEEKYSEFVFDDIQKTKIKRITDSLNPERYFTENEIKKYESQIIITAHDFNVSEEEKNTVIFDNVIKNSEGIYVVGSISMKDIVQLARENKLIYDINCQREQEKVYCRGIYFAQPKVYSKSVKEMSPLMVAGKYIPTAITLNVPNSGYENIEYNEETKQLKIVLDKYTSMLIIDGFHRLVAGESALESCESKGKSFNQMMMLNVFNITPAKARDYIVQEAKKNAIDPSWLKVLVLDIINDICININTSGDSRENPLRDKLGKDNKDVYLLGKLTTLEIFSTSLKKHFAIDEKDIRSQRRLAKFIKDFYSVLFCDFIDDLEDTKKSREQNYKLNSNMFYAYNYMLWKVYNLDNWEDVVFNVVEKMDFRKDGILLECGVNKTVMNKTEISKLESYMNDLLSKEINIR